MTAQASAVSMETANLIRKLRLKPKRTIRCNRVDDEENGEAGSKAVRKGSRKRIENHFAAMEQTEAPDPDRR